MARSLYASGAGLGFGADAQGFRGWARGEGFRFFGRQRRQHLNFRQKGPVVRKEPNELNTS